MNENKFSPRAEEALRLSQEAAGELGHGYVGTEHLLAPWRQSAAAMAAGSEWRIGITWIASGCLPSRQPCSADWRLTFEVKTWRSWSRSS